jgi:hypothetical protein
MSELQVSDPIRMAWNYSASGELWATLPRKTTQCSPLALSMAFSIYLGTTNPSIEAVIESGMFEFRDKNSSNGQPTVRRLDPYGHSLSLYGGKGNFRVGMHNSVESELALVGKLCGLDVVRQDSEVFGGAIPTRHQRDQYARETRQTRMAGNAGRGGIIPDLTVRNFPAVDGDLPRTRLYEVKTMGHIRAWYEVQSSLGDPVTRRDAKISGDYENLARTADVKYCGTPVGADGPLLLRLRQLAPVNGLVVGANGEWSRGVDTFIADISKVASSNPERFGCCHGEEQARAVIAAMAKDRIGRVALRGAAQVRVAALLAITGRAGADPGANRHNTPDTHDEWDRAGGNAPAPPIGVGRQA